MSPGSPSTPPALTAMHRFDEAVDHPRQAMARYREPGDSYDSCQAVANVGKRSKRHRMRLTRIPALLLPPSTRQ